MLEYLLMGFLVIFAMASMYTGYHRGTADGVLAILLAAVVIFILKLTTQGSPSLLSLGKFFVALIAISIMCGLVGWAFSSRYPRQIP